MDTVRIGHQRPMNYEIGVYVAIGFGVGVLIVAVVIMAVLVMRLLRKMRKEDSEERVTEGRDQQNDISLETFHSTYALHQDTSSLVIENDNANTMQDASTATARTPSPFTYTPGNTWAMNPAMDAECKQERSCPLQNTPDGSISSPLSALETTYVDEGTDSTPLYDHPPNPAVPIAGAIYYNGTTCEHMKMPVPVNETTNDESIYQRPKNNPVPINGARMDESVYQCPKNTPVLTSGARMDESVYQCPKNTPVLTNGARMDEPVYQLPRNTPVPTNSARMDESVYQFPKNTPVPTNGARNDESTYQCPKPIPVPTNGAWNDESVYQCPKKRTPVPPAPLYDRPPQNPVPVTDAYNDEDIYDRLSAYVSGNKESFYQRPKHMQDVPLYDRPPQYPTPVNGVSCDESVYERLSALELEGEETDETHLYANLPPVVAAEGYDKSLPSSRAPRPVPRRLKSNAGGRDVQRKL